MERNNLQPNNTYNASFAPNPAYNANQQQGANPQGGPVPPLANASDLSAHPSARNLQEYNIVRTPQGWIDSWNWPQYQPIKPEELGMEKLADEAKNTTKLNMYLENAQKNEELGDFQDAEEAYEKALKYTENAEHYKLYASCLQKISASLKDETKASVYREKAARAFYYLGDLYQKQGNWKEAQAAYKASCDLALYEAPLQALVDIARHLEETMELAHALEKLADFYAEKGAIALAIQMLEEALQVEKSSTLLEKLATLHAQVGGENSQSQMHELAIQRFELQLSQDPKNIGLYRKYAWFLKDIGRRNEARAVKERMDELLQQKLVKQKTKIGDLKQTIHLQDGKLETLGKQVEFLEKQVIHLDFSRQTDITDAVLHTLPEHFENLQELNVTRCKQITEAGLESIAEKASKLKRLTLDYCPGTTIKVLHKLNKKGIIFTIEGVTFRAKSLNLSSLSASLTDKELRKALETNPEITELDLSGFPEITDEGLAPLKSFKWLTRLNLNHNNQLTDAGLKHLAGLTQLTDLSLHNCDQLTDAGLKYLAGLTRLTYLNLSYCKKVTSNAKWKLKRQIPRLKIHGLGHEYS